MTLDRMLCVICFVVAIVALIKKDFGSAIDLILLAIIYNDSAELKELKREVKKKV